jgi:hypothetical protein
MIFGVKRAGDERRSRGVAERRRAQMCLSQLRWLEGFAADGQWYVVDGAPAPIALDGLALSQARRTVNTLLRDHRRSLERFVGDVGAWQGMIDGVLSRLGRYVRESAASCDFIDLASPRQRKAALALEAAHPALRALVRAAVSTWLLRPDLLAAALSWIQARAQRIGGIVKASAPEDLRRVLQLARLGPETEGVDALLGLLSMDIGHPQRTAESVSRLLERLRTRAGGRDIAPPRLADSAYAWVDGLLKWPEGERERAVALVAAADLARALDAWRTWEARYRPTLERAAALAQVIDSGPPIANVRRVIASVQRAQTAMPRALRLDEFLSGVASLAEAHRKPFHRAVLRFVLTCPGKDLPEARANYVAHAAEVVTTDEHDGRVAWLWEALAQERAAGASARVLEPWKRVFAGKAQGWLERGLLEDARQSREVKKLATAMARLAADGPASAEHGRRLGAVLAGGLDVAHAVALVRGLEALDIDVSAPLVRGAVALAGPESPILTKALQDLSARLDGSDYRQREALAALCEHVSAVGDVWMLRGLLENDLPRLMELVDLAMVAPRKSWPAHPKDALTPGWIAAYPPSLAAGLARLASVDPDAERTARRCLAPEIRDQAQLERELATLRARAPLGDREARRVQNLEARLRSPKPLSPARIARLADRLDAAAVRAAADRYLETLRASAQARVQTALGLEGWLEGASDRGQWSVLFALTRLEAPQRALAARLLRAREGPPPWDLRDDPVNRAFLARPREYGLDLVPWLDDAPRVVTAGDGRPLEIALCGDPLEVFAMGRHFNTCLSPDATNFFSVVTNAADVNKRVLYARREGKVVGRCLLALTEAGDVLTFQPYAHDHRLAFDDLVRQYTTDLAARMGSRLVSRGRVPLLLGSKWYDDGAQDVYDALARPELEAALRDVAPSGLIALLERALGRAVDDITLPVVLEMGVFASRPELIGPLAPRLLAQPTLPDGTLVRAARLAMRIGDLSLADRLVSSGVAWRDFDPSDWSVGEILAQTRPSFTLARLRQTRSRGVRRWEHESRERAAVAALAFETLRRPRRAIALYRQALATEDWLERTLRPRLAALETAHR